MVPPGFLRVFFWDIVFEQLDLQRDQDLIISRIAEYGTDEAVRWLRKTYTNPEISRALENRRAQVSRRTLGLWRLWLEKPEEWCSKTPSRPLKGVFWKA